MGRQADGVDMGVGGEATAHHDVVVVEEGDGVSGKGGSASVSEEFG